MIRSFNDLFKADIHALDGGIGRLKDICFDDRSWKIRYFIVGMESDSNGRDILVPPAVTAPFDGVSLEIKLTRDEIRNCSEVESDAIHNSYYSEESMADSAISSSAYIDRWKDNPHLKSSHAVCCCRLNARDGIIGVVDDLLMDDVIWLTRFIVAKINRVGGTQLVLLGHPVIDQIDWIQSKIHIAASMDDALRKPLFSRNKYIDKSYETILKDICDDSGLA